MKPQILALLGSPLPEGNTAKLLKQAIAGAEKAGCEVTLIDVPSLEFSSCREMYFCKEQSSCIMEDDMGTMYPLLKNMDSLIIATPVMTMGIPGHLKSFMDRCQVFYCAKYERNPGIHFFTTGTWTWWNFTSWGARAYKIIDFHRNVGKFAAEEGIILFCSSNAYVQF